MRKNGARRKRPAGLGMLLRAAVPACGYAVQRFPREKGRNSRLSCGIRKRQKMQSF
jgi:hypothetical protein